MIINYSIKAMLWLVLVRESLVLLLELYIQESFWKWRIMKLIHQDKTSKIKLKKIVFILVVISLMFLSVKDVNAIGVSPGRTTINYAPNLEQTVNFRVISNDNEDTNLVIFVREELNQSVTLYDTLVELKAGESKTLRYDVKLPS